MRVLGSARVLERLRNVYPKVIDTTPRAAEPPLEAEFRVHSAEGEVLKGQMDVLRPDEHEVEEIDGDRGTWKVTIWEDA